MKKTIALLATMLFAMSCSAPDNQAANSEPPDCVSVGRDGDYPAFDSVRQFLETSDSVFIGTVGRSYQVLTDLQGCRVPVGLHEVDVEKVLRGPVRTGPATLMTPYGGDRPSDLTDGSRLMFAVNFVDPNHDGGFLKTQLPTVDTPLFTRTFDYSIFDIAADGSVYSRQANVADEHFRADEFEELVKRSGDLS